MPHPSSLLSPARLWKARPRLEYLEPRRLLNGDPNWTDPNAPLEPPPTSEPSIVADPTSGPFTVTTDPTNPPVTVTTVLTTDQGSVVVPEVTWTETPPGDTPTDQPVSANPLDAVPAETGNGTAQLPASADPGTTPTDVAATADPAPDGTGAVGADNFIAGDADASDPPTEQFLAASPPIGSAGSVVAEQDAGPQFFSPSSPLTGVGNVAVTQEDSGPLFFVSTNGDRPEPPNPDGTPGREGEPGRVLENQRAENQTGDRPELDERALAGAFPAQQAGEQPALNGEEAGGANRRQQADLAPLHNSPLAGAGIVVTGRAEREPSENQLPPPIPPGPLSGPDGLPLQAETPPASQAPQTGAELSPSLLPELFRYGAPLAVDAFSGPLALVGAHGTGERLAPAEDIGTDLSTYLAAEDARHDRQLALAAAVVGLGVQRLALPDFRRPAPPERPRWRVKR